MLFNIKDLITLKHGYKIIEAKIILLWKPADTNDWEQILYTSKIAGDFPFNKSHLNTWGRNNGCMEVVSDIDKYVGCLVAWIEPARVISTRPDPNIDFEQTITKAQNSIFCRVCTNQAYMAEPNQTDGTFICFTCRQYPIRQYY